MSNPLRKPARRIIGHKVYHCPSCYTRWQRQPLTPQQGKLLRFLREYRLTHPLAPSFAEIRAFLGLRADSTVHEHLTNLERKGYISRPVAKAERGIILIPPYHP